MLVRYLHFLVLLPFIKMVISRETIPNNILAVFPIASKSHHYMFRSIVKELGNRGHNLTVISPYDMYNNLTNVKQIILHSSAERFLDEIDFNKILSLGKTPLFFPPEMSFWFYGLMMCNDYLKSDTLQEIINSKNDRFDLLLLETSFGQESFIGLSQKFNASVISLNSAVNFLFLDIFVGNPLSLAFVPHVESQIASPMSFFERLWNVVRSFVILTYGYYFYLPKHEMLMKKYLNFATLENVPPIVDMLKNNISLTISNSHISLENSRALVPSVVGAAGLHIDENPPPLPKELQEYMNSSTHGVIYFSFGTIIPAHLLPNDTKLSLLKGFSKLKQNILWKANVDLMENLPKNVKIAKWFPQQAILAHKNCKAFVTHGGIFSIQESIYFGVPLVGIPYFSDQNMNIARAEKVGYALKLSRKNISAESINWALNEVVTNPKYKDKAKQYSKIFRDNPVEKLDNVIFWIEYVMRHKGAKHLRVSSLDLSMYQYLLLDVILFIFLGLIIAFILFIFITKLLFNSILKYLHSIKIRNKKSD